MESPPQIRSPLVISLFAYWNRIRAGRIAPLWSDVQPGDIKSLLPYIMVVEVLELPFDVRYRIVGTAVVEAFGYDFTWETLRLPKHDLETAAWLGVYREFVERQGPCFAQYKVSMSPKDALVVDVGVFPLSRSCSFAHRPCSAVRIAEASQLEPRRQRPALHAHNADTSRSLVGCSGGDVLTHRPGRSALAAAFVPGPDLHGEVLSASPQWSSLPIVPLKSAALHGSRSQLNSGVQPRIRPRIDRRARCN